MRMTVKNRIVCLISCLLILLIPLLAACEQSGGGSTEKTAVTKGTSEEVEATNGTTTDATTKATKATTERTTAMKTEATTQVTQTTEGSNIITNIPTDLKLLRKQENIPVARSIPGITVSIDQNTSIRLSTYSWATVTQDENGTLYVSASLRYSHVDPYGCTVFLKSTDGGMTWSEPRIISDTPADDRDSGIVYLGNGKMLVSWFNHRVQNYINGPEEYTAWQNQVTPEQKTATLNKLNSLPAEQKIQGSWVILSDDYGNTWGEPIRVPVTAPHGPTLMRDGKTLMYIGTPTGSDLVPGFESMRAGIHIITSTDGGRTWSYRSSLDHTVFGSSYYGEPYIIQLDDGSFLAAVRTASTVSFSTVYLSRSKDGYTWTTPQPLVSPVLGAPAHFLQLSNGVVIMAYSCRNMQECGSRMIISYDRGATWSEEMIINIGRQPRDGDNGYPSTVELADGSLVTVYYQKDTGESTPSLLCTKWKLIPAS